MSQVILVRVSGWHPTLPRSEVKAVLEAEGIAYRLIEEQRMLLRLRAGVEAMEVLKRRCSYVRRLALELTSCEADVEKVKKEVYRLSLPSYFEKGRSFKVLVERLDPSMKGMSKPIEEIVGEAVKRRGFKVNLKNPEYTIVGFLVSGKLYLGIQLGVLRFTELFLDRMPSKRPILHPSTLQPDIARCLVNLSRAKPGDLLLDAFCGIGGILIEASLLGCRVVGLDTDRMMLSRARINLKAYGLSFEALIRGDARRIPLRGVDRIVSDPPYGKASSTRGVNPVKLLEEFLHEAYGAIRPGGYLCFMAPIEFQASRLIEETGFILVESHRQRVHGSLTREIFVCRRRN